MQVDLIAHTMMNSDHLSNIRKHSVEIANDYTCTDADRLAEFAGRSCYQSFHKPNPKTRENTDYLANILNQGHESVLEHSSATFYVQGISRALTHELIRHRHLSFSELSQRFVNVEDADAVVPPAIRDHDKYGYSGQDLVDTSDWASVRYEAIARRLTEVGLPRKQAREAARAVMPNATETKIVVTGNHRAWRDVIKKRWSTHADAEIREFAGEVLKNLKVIAPGHFQDIPDTPFGSEDN